MCLNVDAHYFHKSNINVTFLSHFIIANEFFSKHLIIIEKCD
jgi:hypothetical protein